MSLQFLTAWDEKAMDNKLQNIAYDIYNTCVLEYNECSTL